jgi:uncharacterized membrane protein YqhA
MIEQLFKGSRFLVLCAVASTAVASVVLYAVSLNIQVQLMVDLYQEPPWKVEAGKLLAVKLLKQLDLLFIAITFHLISASLYRLFITPEKVDGNSFLNALDIKTFHDLKCALIQVSVVIMVILFLEQVVEIGATLETLYLGAAIGFVAFAAIYAWNSMQKA